MSLCRPGANLVVSLATGLQMSPMMTVDGQRSLLTLDVSGNQICFNLFHAA